MAYISHLGRFLEKKEEGKKKDVRAVFRDESPDSQHSPGRYYSAVSLLSGLRPACRVLASRFTDLANALAGVKTSGTHWQCSVQ